MFLLYHALARCLRSSYQLSLPAVCALLLDLTRLGAASVGGICFLALTRLGVASCGGFMIVTRLPSLAYGGRGFINHIYL